MRHIVQTRVIAIGAKVFSTASNFHILLAAVLLVAAPLAVFAQGLELVPRLLVFAGAGLAVFVALRTPHGPALAAPVDWRILGACAAAGFGLCLLGGEGHVFYSPIDWFARDAVLADLVSNEFPVFYRYNNADYMMRAPLGMYVVPALAGHALGLAGAHYALLVQNALLVAALLYLVMIAAGEKSFRLPAMLVFFGSIDCIPRLVYLAARAFRTGAFSLDGPLMFWNPAGQTSLSYWGLAPNLFWAPNHLLAGWCFGVLFLLHLQREIDIALLALVSAALLFWSPLPMIGALPFLALAGAKALRENPITPRNALAALAALCLAPVLVYLGADAGAVTKEWFFHAENFWRAYVFLLIFCLPAAWILVFAWPTVPDWQKSAAGLAIAMLIVLPFYRIGVSAVDNDITTRCAIVPFFILGFVFCSAAPKLRERGRALAAAAGAVAVLSSVTGLGEIQRAISGASYTASDCNLVTVTLKTNPGFPLTNYLAKASAVPPWLLPGGGRRLEAENRLCWPGYLFMDGK